MHYKILYIQRCYVSFCPKLLKEITNVATINQDLHHLRRSSKIACDSILFCSWCNCQGCLSLLIRLHAYASHGFYNVLLNASWILKVRFHDALGNIAILLNLQTVCQMLFPLHLCVSRCFTIALSFLSRIFTTHTSYNAVYPLLVAQPLLFCFVNEAQCPDTYVLDLKGSCSSLIDLPLPQRILIPCRLISFWYWRCRVVTQIYIKFLRVFQG